MRINRVIVIVLDSVGIGALPDAHKYGDEKSNTLGNIIALRKNIKLNNLISLGLANIEGVTGLNSIKKPVGSFGRMMEKSSGKDTITGHWEMSGIILNRPFPVYPDGFPKLLIDQFKQRIGRDILGNKPASGTEIINELAEQHIKTGFPIVYTSADSVFQIAAHKSVIALEELYKYCLIARELLVGEHAVGRVIARPFTGEPGNFVRTHERKDFAIEPIYDTVLDNAVNAGLRVAAVGKINNIFADKGITDYKHTTDNDDGISKTIEYIDERFGGIIFTNLIDFDMLYGHRNDIEGYANALEKFDKRLPEIISAMNKDDVLFITADHGCDPTTAGTDHSREYVPLLVYGSYIKNGINIGTRASFADLGATLSDLLEIVPPQHGESFKNEIINI